MLKIMFVCHGNICRSPMAEFILNDIINKKDIKEDVFVQSAATSQEEVGNAVYPPVRALLASKGIDSSGKYATQLKKSDYDKYDLFIGMDSANIRNMMRIFGGDPHGKIRKMMSFCKKDTDVADPWYTGDFELAYRDIRTACEEFVKGI